MLEALSASGESDTAFSRRTGVAPHRIWYWRKKLEADTPAQGSPRVTGFVPVRVIEEPRPAVVADVGRHVEATLPGGAQLVFRGAWDRAALRPWLAALRASDAE